MRAIGYRWASGSNQVVMGAGIFDSHASGNRCFFTLKLILVSSFYLHAGQVWSELVINQTCAHLQQEGNRKI